MNTMRASDTMQLQVSIINPLQLLRFSDGVYCTLYLYLRALDNYVT